MTKLIKHLSLICCLCIISAAPLTAKTKKITVDPSGKGDFSTIQAAINSLPDSSAEPTTIYIKKGTYREKLYIEKSNIIFEGQDMDKTIITDGTARDEWYCTHKDDWGVATINVNGNDITFLNLTVVNSYGFDNTEPRTVPCPLDTVYPLKYEKVVKPTGHQMALRTMKATRLKAINCRFRSMSGDTVSPWNVDNGMFYFKDCFMEGGVDFYCPRGWAYAENCHFFAHVGSACIWHDGSKIEDSKTVLKNCSFDGYNGFNLGRYHRDAQFYIIDCSFTSNMADKPIDLVLPTKNVIKWGHRVYYYNCHRKGGDYDWFANNLQAAPGSPDPKNIDAHWVFGDRWNVLEKN